jgi:hypothetical protein
VAGVLGLAWAQGQQKAEGLEGSIWEKRRDSVLHLGCCQHWHWLQWAARRRVEMAEVQAQWVEVLVELGQGLLLC